jgi:transcriptional regulator with XRE-family HTH domain
MHTKNKTAAEILKKQVGTLTLGKLIRSIRLGEAVTQDKFSEKLGISKQQLSDIENNRKSISAKSAALYAQLLGYSEEQFVKLSLQDNLRRNGLHYIVELRLQ